MEKVLNTTLFGNSKEILQGWGYHNVGSLFRTGGNSLIESINQHYGQRCGHLPDTQKVGVLVEPITEAAVSQIEYLSKLLATRLEVKNISDQTDLRGALVVPYINLPTTEEMLRSYGASVWGLPSALVSILKNKAECHRLISQSQIDNLKTPAFSIAQTQTVVAQAKSFLENVVELYKSVDMADIYPLGAMLRAAESDGNYGACIVVEDLQKIAFIPNGDQTQKEFYRDWNSALQAAEGYLATTTNVNLSLKPEVVITRYMDLADSPGLSVVIQNGHITPLGWNAQVQTNGSSACVGTSSYQPKNDYLRKMQEEHEEGTACAFGEFLKFSAKRLGLDFSQITGVANIDLMIPGEREVELQHRLGKNPSITVAEINPRFTNWTDALLLSLWANNRPKTIYELRKAIQNGVLTADKYPLPQNSALNEVRDKIAKLDQKLQYYGTRIIVRMADNPLGIIFIGDIDLAKTSLHRLVWDNYE